MIKKLSLLVVSLMLLSISTFAQQRIVGTYYADWSISPLGSQQISPAQFTDLKGLNLVVHFGDGNVHTTYPYFGPAGGAQGLSFWKENGYANGVTDSACYQWGDWYNPGQAGTNWQKALIDTVHAHGGKVLITVQAVMPDNFKTVIADSAKTEDFTRNIALYCQRKNYDGCETDAEFWASPKPPVNNLVRYYRLLRKNFDAVYGVGKATLVACGGRSYEDIYPSIVSTYVDYYFFMLYDYQFCWSQSAGANVSYPISPLYTMTPPGSGYNVASVVSDGPAKWASLGWPKAKLVSGFPSYGFKFTGTTGWFQKYSGYAEVSRTTFKSLPVLFDAVSKSSYVISSTGLITFDDASSLKAKWDYIVANGFGGMFLYDVGKDVDATKPNGTYTPLHNSMLSVTTGGGPVISAPVINSFTSNVSTLASPGGNVTLSWNVTDASNTTSLVITANNGPTSFNSTSLVSSQTIGVTQTTTFTLTATNSSGSTSKTVTITVTPATNPIVINSFTSNVTTLTAPGGNITLSWNVTDASNTTTLKITSNTGPTSFTSNVLVSSQSFGVTQTTTFTLTATNATSNVTKSVTITVVPVVVNAPVINSFTSNVASLPAPGGNVTLSWNVTDALNSSTMLITSNTGPTSFTSNTLVSSQAFGVTQTTTFTLKATNAGGSVTKTVTITIVPVNNTPVVNSFTSNITSMPSPGGNVMLSWNVTDASNTATILITANNGPTSFNSNLLVSSQSFGVSQTTTFTLTAKNTSGSASKTVTITVVVPTTSEFVFDEAFVNGWNTIRSWSQSNSVVTTPVHDGTKSLKVVASAWSSLQFSKGSWSGFTTFTPTTYKNISFWIYPTKATTNGQVFMKTWNASNKGTANFNIGALAANTWTFITVPISSLTTVNYVSVDIETTIAVTYYLDTVKFDK